MMRLLVTTVIWLLVLDVGRCARVKQRPASGETAVGGITSFKPGGNYILLTFDDGPHPLLTPKLLDVLKAKKVRCTFFVQGSKAVDHPELLRRMVAEGHEVASHGWFHTSITQLRQEDLAQQLQHTSKTIEEIVKKRPVAYRPPHGHTNKTLNAWISTEMQVKVLLWNLDSLDWENRDAAFISNHLLKHAKPGDVILAHDTSAQMVAAVEAVVDGLVKAGYELLTVSEMLSFPDDTPK